MSVLMKCTCTIVLSFFVQGLATQFVLGIHLHGFEMYLEHHFVGMIFGGIEQLLLEHTV